MIAAALGALLGCGLLLVASQWLWPARPAEQSRRGGLMRDRLAQAGLPQVAPGAFVAVSAALAVVVATGLLATLAVPVVAVAAGILAGLAPWAGITGRARRRRRRAHAAWPDLVDHLVAGIRSGVPLTEAVAALAEIGPADFRPVFAAFGRETRSGPIGPALDRLKDELADPVADRVVETLRLARAVGGAELPSVLRALSASLREDAAARSEAEARRSWIVVAARLGLAAPWLVLLVVASRPEAADAYNTPAGTLLLVAGLTISVVAYRLMLLLGRIPDERRWFA